jgi:hypothetical protein
MDTLHACIALGPVAMYLLVLGAINLSPRPMLTTGTRDLATLGIAISGFVIAGPLELFLPVRAIGFWGPAITWGLMFGIYILGLLLVVLTLRPRLVIYNASTDQVRAVLGDVAARLDRESQWAGDSLTMPSLGVHLHVEPLHILRNVQLVSAGPHQNFAGWGRLEVELTAALRTVPGSGNPAGFALVAMGLAFAAAITFWLWRDPASVLQAVNQMLRQ